MDLMTTRERLAGFLEKSAEGLAPGRFRFCLEGSLVPVTGRQAQVSTCFALKAAWQAGIWNGWPEARRREAVAFIKSFQSPDGWFTDPWLERAARPDLKRLVRHGLLALAGRVSWRELIDAAERNRRAETRQSVATLFMVDDAPQYPPPLEQTSPAAVRAYLESFDWRLPWSAGSHLSHVVFFLAAHRRTLGQPGNYDELIDGILDFLHSIRDVETGCWFRGRPPEVMKINGAMKIFTALQWIERAYPDCTRLLDFALRQPFQTDGCGFLNRLFVVHEARRGAPEGYRRDAIRSLGGQALEAIAAFQKPDGGFSFYEAHAQTRYYGATVSPGLPVGDLHGSAMMVWATALALDLMGDDAPPGAEQWKAHRT